MSASFRLHDVSKRFGPQIALDHVTLEAPGGSVVALLGENGAGKTTALRILLGLLEPDAGTAEVLGMDSRRQGLEIRRRVGYVPDRPSLYDWMTVAEAGWFATGFYPFGYLPEYDRLVSRFELPPDRKIKALSKGMRAKVSLSLAMAHEPDLLILDEPTSGLDPMVRREFLESMVDVAATGRTVLLSSHQIVEVERVADFVAILRHGRLVLMESLEDLKHEVHEVLITPEDPQAAPPALPARIIHASRQDRQWRLLVRDGDQSQLEEILRVPGIAHAVVRRPSLEEIFLAYMRPNTAADSASSASGPGDPAVSQTAGH